MHQESFSAQGTNVSLETKCVMDTETAPLEQMRLCVQVKVQIIRQDWLFQNLHLDFDV